ncbi:MAG TPA: hypothetical protein PLX95_03365 [bacterium]|nr:hypothetical protein [bacterium]
MKRVKTFSVFLGIDGVNEEGTQNQIVEEEMNLWFQKMGEKLKILDFKTAVRGPWIVIFILYEE